VFLNFFDDSRGSLAWAGSDGALKGENEFSFTSIENPIQGLIGAIDLGKSGKFWFLQSQFDVIGFQSQGDGAEPLSRVLPIEHDSSFPGQEFSEMFNAVVVGTPEQPLPGVYIDSTLVRGNQVSVAVLNPATGEFSKPLRYSLQIPNSCVQMSPVHLNDAPDSFALPFFCQSGSQVEYRTVRIH
jgi:hypothetical protein